MAPDGGNFPILDGQTVIFIGDSITDCGRRGEARPFGNGYVQCVIDLITARYPQRRITYNNKGVSGDTSVGLHARWGDDVIALDADWVSVLIGINDLHRRFSPGAEDVPPQRYEQAYRAFLAQTAAETEAHLILMDPFYVSSETRRESPRAEALDGLGEYIEVVHELADEFDTLHVPLHEVFQKQLQFRPADLFGAEPVHPNQFGHTVIAEAWLSAVGW